jgi:DnaJ-class molecular chaperone
LYNGLIATLPNEGWWALQQLHHSVNVMTKACLNCDGEGIIPLTETQEQELRNDAEYYRVTGDEPATMATCFTCNGEGSVPEDYEPCGDCGYDHGYETAMATTAHTNMMFEQALGQRLFLYVRVKS